MIDTAYIAAPYSERELAIATMRRLEVQGVEVTSRWLKVLDTLSDEHAQNDLDDVARAAVLVALNPEGWGEKGTGGRHIEFGYALALGKPILLVGARTNIFHYLRGVNVIDDTEDLTKHVKRLARESLSGAIITRDNAALQILAEFRRAEAKHKPMNSPHEGYAVILEELDELWAEIKDNRGRSQDALLEAVQVAAMGLRYVVNLAAREQVIAVMEPLAVE